jgi:hypothetical protein
LLVQGQPYWCRRLSTNHQKMPLALWQKVRLNFMEFTVSNFIPDFRKNCSTWFSEIKINVGYLVPRNTRVSDCTGFVPQCCPERLRAHL